ncbi:hypothetical protein Tco_0971403 [Tanacetum coccineum]
MAGTIPSNLVVRRAIDDLADFSGETVVLKYIKFFIAQQIVEGRHFVNLMRDKAQTARNCIAQLNAIIAEMEAIEDQDEVYDSLICLKEDRRGENKKLMALNDLIAQAERGRIKGKKEQKRINNRQGMKVTRNRVEETAKDQQPGSALQHRKSSQSKLMKPRTKLEQVFKD